MTTLSILSQKLNDSESEDVLSAVDPNEVLPRKPLASLSCQLIYDISSLGAVMTETGQEDVISIELGEFGLINLKTLGPVTQSNINHTEILQMSQDVIPV